MQALSICKSPIKEHPTSLFLFFLLHLSLHFWQTAIMFVADQEPRKQIRYLKISISSPRNFLSRFCFPLHIHTSSES
jgi:hypothetical protein